jgi:hypothetical protein
MKVNLLGRATQLVLQEADSQIFGVQAKLRATLPHLALPEKRPLQVLHSAAQATH